MEETSDSSNFSRISREVISCTTLFLDKFLAVNICDERKKIKCLTTNVHRSTSLQDSLPVLDSIMKHTM